MNPIIQNQLKKIAKDTTANTFGTLKPEQATKLAQYIDVNTAAGTNAEGLVQVRLNAEGSAAVAEKIEPKARPVFAVEQASALPVKTRAHSPGNSLYPFDDLAAPANGVYSKFRVMDADIGKDAYKALSSTVSGAKARYVESSVPVLDAAGQPVKGRGGHAKTEKTYSREFEAFRIEGGVEIYRTK